MNKSTIAIINDSEVTAGSLPNNIISINAWDINWDEAFSLIESIILKYEKENKDSKYSISYP